MSSYLAHKRKGFQGAAPAAFDGFGNRSRSFNGVDDYVTIPDNPSLPTGAQTISAWVKTENVGDYADIVSHWDNAGEAGFVILKLQDNQIAFYITNTGSTAANGARFTQTGSGNTINVGSWYHVSCVFDPSTSMKIYINGILTSTNSNSIHSSIYDSGNDLFIGERADIANRNWHGNIADVRIYDTDLTATEISDLYNGTNITTNLVGHWLTDADNVLDAAGTNHGTNYGSKYSYDNPSPPVEFGSASRIFNGTSDNIDLPSSTASFNTIHTSRNFTISFWAKWDDYDLGNVGAVMGNNYQVADNGFLIQFDDRSGAGLENSIGFYVYQSNGSFESLVIENVVPDDGWHHWTVKGDFPNVSIYRDGISVGSGSLVNTTTGDAGNDLNIGRINDSTTPLHTFDGSLADVRIYDTYLTASQISDIYNGTNITTNLVGHWLTDNDDVEDKAGTNDGTNFGSTYSYDNPPMDLVPSRQASRSFNGVDDYITVQDGSWIPTGEQTWAFWAKPTGAVGVDVLFAHYQSTATGTASFVIFTTTDGKLNATVSTNGFTNVTIASSSSAIVTGTWCHVAVQYIPSTRLSIFINGAENGVRTTGVPASVFNTTVDVSIGAYPDGALPFEGNICDCRIYDTDLTASQILAIYNGTTDRTNLVGQWLTNSDDVVDHAGTNDGTNNGSTYSTDSPS